MDKNKTKVFYCWLDTYEYITISLETLLQILKKEIAY